MKGKLKVGLLVGLLGLGVSCSSVHKIQDLPESSYTLSGATFKGGPHQEDPDFKRRLKAELTLTDSTLIMNPVAADFSVKTIPFRHINELRFYRRTFDVDILTLPFKIRPSVKGFPEQLNANFSAALYLGSRKDHYWVRNVSKRPAGKIQVTGLGLGYGGFLGIGLVTMNPFVTQKKIDYEYDGFVITAGSAAIYDVKKINLGLAIGIDHLIDKNRNSWIYQNRPWFGMLFGINLN